MVQLHDHGNLPAYIKINGNLQSHEISDTASGVK